QTKQYEAASIKVQGRTAIVEPDMRRARTRTRRSYKISRFVRIGWGAVGDANRRVFIPVADLQSRGAPHPANIADKRFADACSHLCSSDAVLFDRRGSTAVLLLFQMEFGGHSYIASA